MIYIRGRRGDYDGWAATGCDGWGYDEVLPYFRRSESNDRLHDEFHGIGGELLVTDLVSPNPMSVAFVDACGSWGMPANADFNGASQEGAGLYQVTQKKGTRWSAAKAFLDPVRKRTNLTVETGAHATEIVVDGLRAVGVAYVVGKERRVVHAAAEVIVAAGAINSPQLLMLSGIGPADELASHGIEPLVNLPVGHNLQDHPVVMNVYESSQQVSLADAEKPKALLEYAAFKRGMLTSNIGEAGCFVKSKSSRADADIQFHFGPAYFVEHGFQTFDGHAFSVGPTLVTVESRGTVELASADPFAKVRIQGNYLSERADIDAMVAGVKISREVANETPLNDYRSKEIYPGDGYSSDAELEEYVRQVAELLYHPVGTCAMGPEGSAVVDPHLKVNGIDGLRVVDASVMPTIVGGNTNAPTIMIAERAADLILGTA
jgi:choline dehydrogenase